MSASSVERTAAAPGVTLCSRRCLREASRELESNARQIKNFQRDVDRSELMARNGTITAALIAWSPA
jgi:hypothetical protein